MRVGCAVPAVVGLWAALAVGGPGAVAADEAPTGSMAETVPLAVVERLMNAFNAHDVEAMAAAVTEDVQWFSVSGAEIGVEADGVDALKAGMKSYFEAIPTARSELEGSFVSGKYVVVRERAYWGAGESERSQSSLAVYEIAGELVRRVWYYPAEG
jgi:hypothetical protein